VDANVIPGEYIVVFKDHVQGVPELARQLAEEHEGTIIRVWEHALKGFAVRLREPAGPATASIGEHPDVAYVSPNRRRSIAGE
jgi:Peptidase inhibitor I9